MGFSLKKAFKKVWKGARSATGSLAPLLNFVPKVGPIGAAVASYIGGTAGDSPERNAEKRQDFEYARSLADQRAFQDDSVQRRVADARKAGIHPLAALGFQSPSFIPQQSSGYYGGGESEYGLSEMGQDIGRAVQAAQTDKERAESRAVTANYDAAILQRTNLENQKLQLDIDYSRLRYLRLLREGNKPGFPDVNAIQQVGLENLNVPSGGSPVQYPYGDPVNLTNPDVNPRLENDLFGQIVHGYKHWVEPWSRNEQRLFEQHTIRPLKKWYSETFPQRRTGNVRQYR